MATTSTEAGSTSQSVHDTDSASSVALSQRSDSSDAEEENEDGTSKLTQKWLLSFFSKDWKNYYRTFELNEKLYLHFKGFTKLRCMDLFPHLKMLYFEGNGCDSLIGLENCPELRCLYIHENCIQVMEGLENLTQLANLNVSDNLITTIGGLSKCENLDMLYLARNRIGRNGLDDLRGLLECPSITTCDLQNNKIDDPEVLDEILCHMPNLKVLYLQGNGVVNKIKQYRKTVIAKLPGLCYLDDRPVFADDRRNAEAFSRGGLDAERAEREIIKQEKRDKDEANRVAFKDMVKKARAEKKQADEEKAAIDEEIAVAKAFAERSASPAENDDSSAAQVEDESKDEESEEADAPPLEEVDAEALKAENEALTNKDKQQRQMYDQIRKEDTLPAATQEEEAEEEDEDSDQGCTIEEVKDEPVVVEEKVAAPVKKVDDELHQMAAMMTGLNVESKPEFVSDLEELD